MKRLRKKPVEDADASPRDGRKQRTRRALMDAALTLLEGERSFSSLSLHALMREARAGPQPGEHQIASSVRTFLQYVDTHRLQFQFIAKERMSGSTAVRLGIRKEIRLWVSELAADLAPLPPLRALNGDTLRLVAGLVVQTMMGATELLLDADPQDHNERARLESGAAKQLTLIFLGAAQWTSDP